MKKALVSLGLAGLLFFTPAMPIYAQNKPIEQTTLEYKIEKTFPNKSVKDIEDFRQYSKDIMKIVAEKMNIKLDERIPKPKIITQEDMNLDEFNRRYAEWCKERGFAPVYLNAMCPMYFEKENEILLIDNSTLHTLAHEFVHYFQVQYRHEDSANDPYDNMEKEAILIQREFQKEYLK
jgi:Zn-dependent peptidase ImmA (M78 family)